MQKLLWQRLQGRCEARALIPVSAGLYNAIVSELEYTLGSSASRAIAGVPPPNPYERAKMFMDNVDPADSAPVRKVPATLQMEDVHILEQFYSQLCLLVQAQKASDPASLLCVHNVCIIRFHAIIRFPVGVCGCTVISNLNNTAWSFRM
jgi:hypothetical protein